MEGKRIGLLVIGAGAYEQNAEGMFTAFDRIVDSFLSRKLGELYVGVLSWKHLKHFGHFVVMALLATTINWRSFMTIEAARKT